MREKYVFRGLFMHDGNSRATVRTELPASVQQPAEMDIRFLTSRLAVQVKTTELPNCKMARKSLGGRWGRPECCRVIGENTSRICLELQLRVRLLLQTSRIKVAKFTFINYPARKWVSL